MASDETAPGFEVGPGLDFRLYRYTPSLEGAIVSVVVFALLTAVHFWRLIRAKSYYFTPFLVGGVCTYSYSPATCFSTRHADEITRG